MRLSRITYSVFLVLTLSGCKYTFTEESEIERKMLEVTPIGISLSEARTLVEEYLGKESYVGEGLAVETDGVWNSAGWYTDQSKKIINEPYYFVFKLGSHPSSYVILPTYVYGRWFFDKNDKLVAVTVIKETDSL